MNLHINIIPFFPQYLGWKIWGDTSGICSEEAWKQTFWGSCYWLCRWTGIPYWLCILYSYIDSFNTSFFCCNPSWASAAGYLLCWWWPDRFSFEKMSSRGRLHHTRKSGRWSLQTPYQDLQQERSFEGNSGATWLLDSENSFSGWP